jgi:ankyrin repeat protein
LARYKLKHEPFLHGENNYALAGEAVVQYLVEKGVSVTTTNTEGKTPIDLAGAYGHDDLVDYLKKTHHKGGGGDTATHPKHQPNFFLASLAPGGCRRRLP